MAITDRVENLVLPLIDEAGLSLYDIELNGGNLRITVDGPDGVLLDQVAALTKSFSHVLDEEDPMPGKYTLEVSSPGLERRLRTSLHFIGAIDEEITVKLGSHVDGQRRLRGVLQSADQQSITLVTDDGASHVVDVDDITKAATVFEWGPAPKPGSGSSKSKNGADQPSAPSDNSEKRAAVQ